MKLKTHNIFSFAIALWISTLLNISNILIHEVVLALFFSIFINIVIDKLGHRNTRRLSYLHSFLGVFILSLLIVMSLYAVLSVILEIRLSLQMIMNLLIFVYTIGLSHLFLDMFTAEGVCFLWPFSRCRSGKISLLKIRYDDLTVNMFMWIISIAIILVYIVHITNN